MNRGVAVGLVLALVTVAALVVVKPIAAGCGDGQMSAGCTGQTQLAQAGHDHGPTTPAAPATAPPAEGPGHMMHAGMGQMCQDCSAKMDAVATSLEAAKKAADAGDAKAAAAEIDKAMVLVKEAQDNMKKMMAGHAAGAKIAVVNVKCPILGGAVDPAKLTDATTRDYKGQKVGFCCPMCGPPWDKLSDAEKDKKVEAVTKPAAAPATPPAGHEGHHM